MDSSASDPSNPFASNQVAPPSVQPPNPQLNVNPPAQPFTLSQPMPNIAVPTTPAANPAVFKASSASSVAPLTPPLPDAPSPAPEVHQAGLPPLFSDSQTSSITDVKSSIGGHKGLKVLVICLVILFVGTFGAGSAAAAIAYGKLPINNPSITKPVTAFVMGLPFMPKTTDYVLTQAFQAEKNIKQTSFDASFSTNLPQLDTLVAGLGKIDLEAKGAVDYSDINNVSFNLNSSITRDFNFDLREKNQVLYFKLNQIPATLEPLIQAQYGDLLNTVKQNWISFDVSSLDTAARRQLDAQPVNNASSFDYNSLLDKKLESELQLTNTTTGSFPVYKVSLNADDALVDDLGRNMQKQQGNLQADSIYSNLSSLVKNLKLALWVDKSTFYIREIDLSFDGNYGGSSVPSINNIQTQVLGASAQSLPISMVVKLSDFNQPVSVDVPSSSIPAQQLYQQLVDQELKKVKSSQATLQSAKASSIDNLTIV